MTYLDLVNNVLRRLREDTVSTINETSHSTLIANIVNDAKRQVEDTWDWNALRETVNVSTSASTQAYSLTGTGNRATIIDAQNVTGKHFLHPKSQVWGRRYDLAGTGEGSPTWFSTDGFDGSGDLQVNLYPTPDGTYSINFNVVQRTADLSADADTIAIPSQPVIQLAYAMAARERGEVGGAMAAEIFGIAKRVLGDAIAHDSSLNSTDMIYYEV